MPPGRRGGRQQGVDAEGAREVLRPQHLVRGAVDEDAPLQQRGLVAQQRQSGEVMGGDEDRVPRTGKVPDHLRQGSLGALVHAGERLVEQEQGSALGDGTGDEDTLALTPGELADLPLHVAGHVDAFERGPDGGVVGGPRPAQPVLPAVAARHHDFAHADGEVPVDGLALRHVRDGTGLPGGDGVGPADGHGAGARSHDAHDRLEEGGLARAVGTDEPAHPAGDERQVDAVERRDGAIVHAEPRDGQGGGGCRGHGRSPSVMVRTSCRSRSR